VVVDEAAFIKAEMYRRGFLPVGLNRHVSTFLATTPGPSTCFFSQLISQVDQQGNPRLPLLVFGRPCDACMKKPDYWTCQHKRHERAPWKDTGRESRWAWMWFGDNEAFAAEAVGFFKGDNRKLVQPEVIYRMRDKPKYHAERSPKFIFITLDFAEGGKDEVALIAVFFTEDFEMVVSRVRHMEGWCFSFAA